MAVKVSKEVKKINKQIKKLHARMDKLEKKLKKAGAGDTVIVEEVEMDIPTTSNFSEAEVEMADEMTEEAEELEDMIEKMKELKKKR
jgi:alpha-galactosidase/6-phospho-beta-glucosidase family protein